MRHSWRRIALLPAVRMLLFIIAGILLQWHLSLRSEDIALPTILLLPGVFVLHLLTRRRRTLQILRDTTLLLLLVITGILRTAVALESRPADLLVFADKKEKLDLIGVVAEHPREYADRRRFRLDCRFVMSPDSIPVRGTVLATYRRSAWDAADTLIPIRLGDVVKLHGRLRTPLTPRNPGGFDARRWLVTEGSVLLCSVSKGEDLEIVGQEDPGLPGRVTGILRRVMRESINAQYASEHAGILTGLLLGDRGMIEDTVLNDFRRTGIMHILAVSGLHAGIILMMVFMPLERLPFAARALSALTVLWLFAAVTGFAPPVTRASIMATIVLVGILLQRDSQPINALAAAGTGILLADPLALFGLSFLLSFGAVLGILLFQQRVQTALLRVFPRMWRPKLQPAAALLSLTLSAQALTLPLLAQEFGQVSPSVLLANLVAVPLVFLTVTCGSLSLLLFHILPALATPFAAVAAASIDLILITSELLARLPGASVSLPPLPSLIVILYFTGIAYLTISQGRVRQKLLVLSITLIAVLTAAPAIAPDSGNIIRVTFLDVGQGDAAVVELPDGSALLIDTGPGSRNWNAGSAIILPFLRARGIRRLHMMIITHPDNDHAGGAQAVVEELPVGQVLVGGRWPESGAGKELMDVMTARTDSVRDVRAGLRIPLPGEAMLYVLSPPADIDCEASNEHSVVVLLRYGTTRFLFTGDADAEAERRMVARYDSFLHADVLKVGHHGSTTSSSPGFVVKVRPRHAVISAGRNNHFNHPRQEVLDRLRLAGAHISRTDIEGAIMFLSDGRRVEKLPVEK